MEEIFSRSLLNNIRKIIQIETETGADLFNLIMYTVNFNSWFDFKIVRKPMTSELPGEVDS